MGAALDRPRSGPGADGSQGVPVAVVDDDDGLRRGLARLLKAAGYKPLLFASAEALLADDQTASRAACLVLDVQLPGLSGLDLQRILAQAESTLPIVFITAHCEPAVCDRAR